MKTKFLAAALIIFGSLAGGVSAATLVFDSFSGGGSGSSRDGGSSPGSTITVSSSTTINTIAVLSNMNGTCNIKFVIFDHATHNLLMITNSKSFGDDGLTSTWKESDPFSFTLQAGFTYDIGAISDTAGNWNFDQTSETMNGMTSIVGNPNFSNFSAPAAGNHAGADAAVRLYAIPEPSSAMLLLVAGGLCFRRRRTA